MRYVIIRLTRADGYEQKAIRIACADVSEQLRIYRQIVDRERERDYTLYVIENRRGGANAAVTRDDGSVLTVFARLL